MINILIVTMAIGALILSVIIFLHNRRNSSEGKNFTDGSEQATGDEQTKEHGTYRIVDSDYAKTVFLYLFKKKPRRIDDELPSYVQYDLEITNTVAYINELIEDEMLEPASYYDMLGMLTVPDLKNILSEKGLKKSGKKDELIKRIIENSPNGSLKIFSDMYYVLSEKGEKFVEEHDDFIIIRQNPSWGINISEYIDIKRELGGKSDFQTIILFLLRGKMLAIKKNVSCMTQYEYSCLHDIYESSADLLLEKEDFEGALRMLLASILLSLSESENFWLISYKRNLGLKKADVMKSFSPVKISPFTISKVVELKECYSKNLLLNVYKNFIGPINVCALDMFEDVVNEILASPALNLSKYEEALKRNFEKKLK